MLLLCIFPIFAIIIIFCLPKNIKKNFLLILSFNMMNFLFLISILIWIFYDKLLINFQFIYIKNLFLGFDYIIGIDGLSLYFILLTTLIFPLCLLSQ